MFALLSTCVLLLSQLSSVSATALDDYVWREDENYKWVDMGPDYVLTGRDLSGKHSWTGYTLNMTSQRWLTDADFAENSDTKSLWWHYLVVIVPDEIKWPNNGTLWITGGSNTGSPPSARDEDIALTASLAMGMGIVCGALFQIPNEHTIFAADPEQKSRSEDAIIAYTWDHFLNDPSQPEWLVRFPMVKASLRAMDTVTDFMKTNMPEKNTDIQSYIVAGASKRGWTTWLVGAVDPARVKAIVPIVLDAINFVEVEHHQFRSYNGWSWALKDYYEMNIMTRLDIPNMDLLQQEEDPYYYKDRLTMPKLVVNAVLDEFQQPDDTHYWWNDMPEPKHFIMTPNAEHSEATGILEIVPAIGTWGSYLLKQNTVPEFTWTIDDSTGEIVATLDDNGDVYEASMWWAYSCGTNTDGTIRRDFRMASLDNPCHCGIAYDGYCGNLKSFWTREILDAEVVDGKRTYRALKEPPSDGRYVAFMIDIKYKELDQSRYSATFDPSTSNFKSMIGRSHLGNHLLPVDKPGRLEFTTEVSILPNSFPFADCSGDGCAGYLL